MSIFPSGRIGLVGAVVASLGIHLAFFFGMPASPSPDSGPSIATVESAEAIFAAAPAVSTADQIDGATVDEDVASPAEQVDEKAQQSESDDAADIYNAAAETASPQEQAKQAEVTASESIEAADAELPEAPVDPFVSITDEAEENSGEEPSDTNPTDVAVAEPARDHSAEPVEAVSVASEIETTPTVAASEVSDAVVAEDLGELVAIPLPIARPNDAAAQEAARQAIARAEQQRAAERRAAQQAKQRAAEQRKALAARKRNTQKAATQKAKSRPTKRAARQSANGRQGQSSKTQRAPTKTASRNSAAVRRYPGRVRSRIASRVRGGARGTVYVSFTVSRGGGLSGARISKSSGSSAADRAALNAVRRAAPFPPIPSEAGRSSWSFTVPIKVR
ncbi:cell envelope integrity protein TolA [Notoacmeibacter sp. MSK16QG-6]|uniref:cell envelope integrity protein TolA n=1 Tax=Notoacmeibacter sp. MSK16QG-6 TaxID=2957982 RepID=UPI00209D77D8|nr:TonB family protein [Notoacmeibacter sp. MSK16QG-6]MCP1198304.1 TonB family protein [Notoacmeibacter sp. MSK16QG-6]